MNNQSKPQRGKTSRNTREIISGNCKSQRRSELAPNRINSEVPAVKFQWKSQLVPKGINSEAPAGSLAPTEFEIQIWVLNLGRGVQYSNIWIHGFLFARITFLLSRQSGKKTDVCYDFKNPPYHPWIQSLLWLENNSLLRCFNSFRPWSQFPIIPDYPGGRGRF